MRIGEIVEFDGRQMGTVCRMFPQGSLDTCEVMTRSTDGELILVTLRSFGGTLVSTNTVCHTIPTDYKGLTVPPLPRSA